MSGGSLDYVYGRIEDAADSIASHSGRPLHRAFAKHLRLVATALHDIEWMFSGDTSPGSEDAAIRAVIAPASEMEAAEENLKTAIAEALKAIPAPEAPKRTE